VLPIYVQAPWNAPVVAGSTCPRWSSGAVAVMLSAVSIVRSVFAGTTDGQHPVSARASGPLLLRRQSPPLPGGHQHLPDWLRMGLLSMTTVALVRTVLTWSMRGSATASPCSRAAWAHDRCTAVGALLNIGIAHYGSGTSAAAVRKLLKPAGRPNQLPTIRLAPVRIRRGLRLELSGIG